MRSEAKFCPHFSDIRIELSLSPVQQFIHLANFSQRPGHPPPNNMHLSSYGIVRKLNIYCFSPETKYSLSIQKFLTRRPQREEAYSFLFYAFKIFFKKIFLKS